MAMITPICSGCLSFSFWLPSTQNFFLHLVHFPHLWRQSLSPTYKETVKYPLLQVSVTARICQAVLPALQWNWSYRHQEMGQSEIHFENGWWLWWQLLPTSQAWRASGLTTHPTSRDGAVHYAGSIMLLGVTTTNSAGRFGELNLTLCSSGGEFPRDS